MTNTIDIAGKQVPRTVQGALSRIELALSTSCRNQKEYTDAMADLKFLRSEIRKAQEVLP